MNKAPILIIAILLILITCLVAPSLTFASENSISIKNEAINPGSFYYFLKRGWEKFSLIILFWPQSKLNYENNLLGVRFAEFKKIAEDRELGEFQKASERLSYQAGVLTDQIVKQKNDQDKQQLMDKFSSFSKILPGLRDLYPANSSFWMLVQHNINTLNILSDKLK